MKATACFLKETKEADVLYNCKASQLITSCGSSMVASREQVFDVIAKLAPKLRALGVKRLALFGSTARGEQCASSDLDFVVRLAKKTFDDYMDVKFLLEDEFGQQVDLVLEDSIKPRLREPILRELVDAPGF